MIMVVTFQEDLRDNLCSFLLKKGYEVCIPPHRQDVCSLVKEKHPLVIVLDMYVAEPNGLQVLRDLRAQYYKGKFVVLAGTSISQVMPQALSLGIDQVVGGPQGIGGPIQFEEVEAAIRMALHPAIAARAFELYEARDRAPGKALEDWLEAERHILNKPSPLSASSQSETKTKSDRDAKKTAKARKPSP